MPANVKLTPGTYRFTTTNPSTSVVYVATSSAILTTFGELLWVSDPAGGHYQRHGISIECADDGSFSAINGPEAFQGTYTRIG